MHSHLEDMGFGCLGVCACLVLFPVLMLQGAQLCSHLVWEIDCLLMLALSLGFSCVKKTSSGMADEQGHPHTQVLVTHVNCEPITDNKSKEVVL